MADRPILFSAPMIRAILDGRKTQTRRVVSQASLDAYVDYEDWCSNVSAGIPMYRQSERDFYLEHSRIWPGDRLWVRETWKPHSIYAEMKPRDIPKTNVFYRADNRYAPSNTRWVPGIHMPRWASRITLLVTDVRIQRLHDISEADAVAEGAPDFASLGAVDGEDIAEASSRLCWAQRWFAELWTTINGPGAWEGNPWVMAVTFRPVLANIDEGAK